jgi:hypothetical protein
MPIRRDQPFAGLAILETLASLPAPARGVFVLPVFAPKRNGRLAESMIPKKPALGLDPLVLPPPK